MALIEIDGLPFLMGGFSMAMLNNQMVSLFAIFLCQRETCILSLDKDSIIY